MNCNQVQDLLIDHLYEETDSETRKALEKHLESCTDCASAFESLTRVRQLCSNLVNPQPSTMTINRILAQARDEAERHRPLWGFGWMKVLSMVCVVVIAGGIVLFQSQTDWFQGTMPASSLNTAPAENVINRSGAVQEARSDHPVTAVPVSTSVQAKRPEAAQPPVGIITTGTSTSVHPQASPMTGGGQVRVSISMHRSVQVPASVQPAYGPDRDSGLKARSPGVGYHAESTRTFTVETYISATGSLEIASPDAASPGLIQAEIIPPQLVEPRIIQTEAGPRTNPFSNEPQFKLASRSVPFMPMEQKTASLDLSPVSLSAPEAPAEAMPSLMDENQRVLDIDRHLQEGRMALEAGLMTQAIYHLEHSLHLMSAGHPQRPHALHHLALAYEKSGDLGKAKSLYQEIVAKYPHFREIAEQRLRTLAAE